jgi:hypothetical protein
MTKASRAAQRPRTGQERKEGSEHAQLWRSIQGRAKGKTKKEGEKEETREKDKRKEKREKRNAPSYGPASRAAQKKEEEKENPYIKTRWICILPRKPRIMIPLKGRPCQVREQLQRCRGFVGHRS